MTVERSPTLKRVLSGELCAGCGLCASVSGGAIEMTWSPRGFKRPVQTMPLTPGAERIIAAACPGAKVAPWPEAPQTDPFWGPWRRVVTGHATNPGQRHAAASGGALSAMLVHALESGLVDRVVHIVADSHDPVGAEVTTSRSAQMILAGAGSRYVASSPLVAMDQMLAEGGALAFVGKPCDVSALRQLAVYDERVAKTVRLTLSFFCAGIPSRRAIARMLAAMGVGEDELEALRYRGFGWPGSAVAAFRGGRRAEMSYEESWGGHLSRDVQFRCKICPDAVGGVADLACGDAWHSDADGYPLLEEQGDGRSVILARTVAGERLLAGAVEAGGLAIQPLEIGELHAMQPAQARRKRLVRARMAGLRVLLQPVPRTEGLQIDEAAQTASVRATLKDFLGSVRRVITGRR